MIATVKHKHKIKITLSVGNDREVREWCEQMFGPGGHKGRWRFGWVHKDDNYYFRSNKDATMFMLRWS